MQLDMADAGFSSTDRGAPRHKTAYIQFEITMGGALSRTLWRRLNGSNLEGKTTEFDFARVSMRRNPSLSARRPVSTVGK